MAELKIIETDDELTHLALAGRLDSEGVQAVELRFSSYTGARRKPTIVDLSELTFIASLGIGMLISAAKGLNLHGVKMVLVDPPEPVEHVLRAANIDRIIQIADAGAAVEAAKRG
jgi:anti-anti-sigma factor